jgi:hypothetical protein
MPRILRSKPIIALAVLALVLVALLLLSDETGSWFKYNTF